MPLKKFILLMIKYFLLLKDYIFSLRVVRVVRTDELQTDSRNYELVTRAIESIPGDLRGLTCEIGVRRGGGSRIIIDAVAKKPFPIKVHVALDPYGNIVYAEKESVNRKLDYTNEMRDMTMGPLYKHAMSKEVNLIFINLEDTEFFKRYSDGVPVYSQVKEIVSDYIFVLFDGPHQLKPLLDEVEFFDARMAKGATIVFDDLLYYDHNKVEEKLISKGWELMEKTERKASYKKI